MWKTVTLEGSEYLIKHSVHEKLHKIYLTNFIHLWFEDIFEENLLDRCRALNIFVEADDRVLLEQVQALLECEGSAISSLTETSSGKKLTLSDNFEDVKFKINFLLAPASQLQFYKEVTQPLLTVVSELENRQQRLMDVIRSKDVEIQEYKLEGGHISRKAVETEPFDSAMFAAQSETHVGVSKSLVDCRPANALSHDIQQLLHHIHTATVIKNEETEPRQTKLNTVVRLNPQKKNKKQKLYEDDDYDDNLNNQTTSTGESKIKQEIQESNRASPGKSISSRKIRKMLI